MDVPLLVGDKALRNGFNGCAVESFCSTYMVQIVEGCYMLKQGNLRKILVKSACAFVLVFLILLFAANGIGVAKALLIALLFTVLSTLADVFIWGKDGRTEPDPRSVKN